uniref:BMA-RILP-1 n=2 Tax=Brugia malayi TaxID=6279 RepID=A0A0H5SA87_BRUMA|nr:BMA-RILP-1 [Brugia malayi]
MEGMLCFNVHSVAIERMKVDERILKTFATSAVTTTTMMTDVRSPADSPSRHITVVDVYDLAASIGKDFERIIDEFGNDSVRQIMPKVISALETLESLANHNEKENEEILMLKKTVERLENEKQMKQQDRIKFELELEAVEENYRKEIDDLWSMVKNLQLENKHLSSVTGDDASAFTSMTTRDEDLKMLLELRELSTKQKEEIKDLQKDISTYNCEVENLHNNVEKLIRQNEELLRKNASLQKQGRLLVEEKSEIIKRLQLTEEANIKLTKLFKDATRQCKDLQQCQVDDNDNAPRFTLSELREVLQEKNLLKGKVLELEEELEQLRPLRRRESVASDSSREFDRSAQTEEYVVYGPINKEPEEKLYPWKYERKESGVRKFFRFFFNKESFSSGGYSPVHASSSPIPSMRSMPSFSGQAT